MITPKGANLPKITIQLSSIICQVIIINIFMVQLETSATLLISFKSYPCDLNKVAEETIWTLYDCFFLPECIIKVYSFFNQLKDQSWRVIATSIIQKLSAHGFCGEGILIHVFYPKKHSTRNYIGEREN